MYSSLDDIKKNRPYNQQSLQKLNTLQSPSVKGPFTNYDKSAINQHNRGINNIINNNIEGNSKGPHFQQNGNIQSSYQIGNDQKNFLESSVSQFYGQSQIKSPTKKPKNQSMIQSYLNNMSATSSKLQKNKPLTKKEIQKKKDEEKNQINKLKLQQTSALNIPEQHTKKLNNIMNNIMNKVIVTNSNGIKNNIYQKNFELKTDKKKEKQPLTSEQFQQLEQKLKQFANQMSKK
ncbi:hypothetical protein PPERSA_01631 [Pseudocohnilembus persalinus]|uniref:Uncharacterized protein n=1 Tax=Pseudocohnilembus persalinus TaxID=266149 RepID=A0A0V0R4N0_PSEPJ|nr:hypothetical protein PPERSA_01631 [Pseudocohnilembus persalinus]|eukprot:KRX09431.1 hypothetical protein PPERSA_01631 [Pseudocohnilembus persalinus]